MSFTLIGACLNGVHPYPWLTDAMLVVSNSMILLVGIYLVLVSQDPMKRWSVYVGVFTLSVLVGGLKYLVHLRDASIYVVLLRCCPGYVLYSDVSSMPSLHCALAFYFAVSFSHPLVYQLFSTPVEDLEEPILIEEEKVSPISSLAWLLLIWTYALVVCGARFYLLLNTALDVLVGVAIGFLVGFVHMQLETFLHKPMVLIKTE